MNLVSAICPSCGAQIQIPPDQDQAFCSYCGNQILVEAAIAYSKVKIDGVVKTQSADFIIEAGTLIEYHGASTDVVVPENVRAIGRAFDGMPITSITLPKGLKRISGFQNCDSLGSIALPEELEEISYAFFGCKSLKSIALPKKLRELTRSFDYSALEQVTIPGSVSTIGDRGDSCFSGCESLKRVNIEEGVSCIGASSFSSCASLEEVIIPSSVKKIKGHAFAECENLSSVTILGADTELEIGTFCRCPSLTNVSVPTSVLEDIFRDHRALKYRPFYDTPWYNSRGKEECRALGICEHCGGSIKGILIKKCSHCGKKY